MCSVTSSINRRVTLIGLFSILIWSTLAIFGVLAGPIPPFQLVAMAFTLVFVLTLVIWTVRGERPWSQLRLPARVWGLGLGGRFGYHLLYFVGIQSAPPAAANLINYLGPTLNVRLSALLPTTSGVGSLRCFHLTGATLGLLGDLLIVTTGTGSMADAG